VAWRARTLLQVNLYRWLAGLPAVPADATRNAKAQQCALMMDANNALSHSPPMTWNCYTANGAEAAGRSNIATTAAVQAVDLYMIDPGNATTLGHRRWILSNSLGPIGMGSTSEDSCLWVLQGTGNANMPWTAWPPPGVFPIEAAALPWSNLNQTGLSIQSDTINLGSATVAIDDGTTSLATTKTALLSGYGSQYAISLVPNGWSLTAGKTYHVDVTGVASPFSYEFTVADCDP
jgi:hypothetical protein